MNKLIVAAFLIIVCHSLTFAQTVESTSVETDAQTVSVTEKTHAETPNAKLIACVKSGDADCVVQALAEGADANAVDEKDIAVLISAAESKNANIVKALLNAGADVNKSREGEAPPLCRAVLFGRKENVEMLLAKGAKVNVVCDADHGGSPLMDALLRVSISDLPDEFQANLKQGSDYNSEDEKQMMNDAFSQPRENFVAIARMLLERGADVNVIAKCDVGETALMYAATSANVEMVKELLARGADANKGGSSMMLSEEFSDQNFEKSEWRLLPALSKSQTALVSWNDRTKKQREQIKELLIKAGGKAPENDEEEEISAEQKANKLQNAAYEVFDDAIESNDAKDLARLIEAYESHPLGAKALPKALRSAVIFSRTELIKLMLESGVNPNIGTVKGRTPLMEAASIGNENYVKMLLDAGADVNLVDDDGHTALDDAQASHKSDERWLAIVELLKRRGAKSKSQQPQN